MHHPAECLHISSKVYRLFCFRHFLLDYCMFTAYGSYVPTKASQHFAMASTVPTLHSSSRFPSTVIRHLQATIYHTDSLQFWPGPSWPFASSTCSMASPRDRAVRLSLSLCRLLSRAVWPAIERGEERENRQTSMNIGVHREIHVFTGSDLFTYSARSQRDRRRVRFPVRWHHQRHLVPGQCDGVLSGRATVITDYRLFDRVDKSVQISS